MSSTRSPRRDRAVRIVAAPSYTGTAAHLDCLLDATSIRKAAGIVGVHRTTSFRWRHRFLTGIEDQPPKHLSGIAEADHVQNVNAYHSRFSRFNGIATRYLPHYLAWRQVIDAKKVGSPEQLLNAAIGPFHN